LEGRPIRHDIEAYALVSGGAGSATVPGLRHAGRMWGRVWADAPRWARRLVCSYAVLLGYGTVVHLVQLAVAPTDPYPWAPTWLAGYFCSLTLLDPLAAALLLARRRAGLLLGCLVFVTDAAANGYACYVLDQGPPLARIGQAVITAIAIGIVLTAPRLARWLR